MFDMSHVDNVGISSRVGVRKWSGMARFLPKIIYRETENIRYWTRKSLTFHIHILEISILHSSLTEQLACHTFLWAGTGFHSGNERQQSAGYHSLPTAGIEDTHTYGRNMYHSAIDIHRKECLMSFGRNFHHLLHWKLSFSQLPVQQVMTISSIWRHFRFNVRVIAIVSSWHRCGWNANVQNLKPGSSSTLCDTSFTGEYIIFDKCGTFNKLYLFSNRAAWFPISPHGYVRHVELKKIIWVEVQLKKLHSRFIHFQCALSSIY